MAHIATRLSQNVELDAGRRHLWDVEVVRSDGGSEVRNSRWSQPLLEFTVSYPPAARDNAVFRSVQNAYLATGGGNDSFAFRDWCDYQATDEEFGIGDGATLAFNLFKNYAFGSASFSRRIYLPVSAITIKKDGVTQSSGYTVSYTAGTVTFAVAPAAAAVLTWSGDFDVPVRFDGAMETTGITTTLEQTEQMTLKEVRL